MRLVRSARRARRLDSVETPAAADPRLSMPARGVLTFVLSQDGCELEDLARVAQADVRTVREWVAELVTAGYAVIDDGVCTVSDDPADVTGAAQLPPGDDVGVRGVPEVVWAALKSTRPVHVRQARPGPDRAAVDAARLTPRERQVVEARLDQEIAAAGTAAATEAASEQRLGDEDGVVGS